MKNRELATLACFRFSDEIFYSSFLKTYRVKRRRELEVHGGELKWDGAGGEAPEARLHSQDSRAAARVGGCFSKPQKRFGCVRSVCGVNVAHLHGNTDLRSLACKGVVP